MPGPGGYWLWPARIGRDGRLGDTRRPVGVREPLPEVDRPGGDGQRGHLGEDRRRERLEPRAQVRHAVGAGRQRACGVSHLPDATDDLGGARPGGSVRRSMPAAPPSLTVASFNLHAGIDGWGRPFDVVAACRDLDADVLVLQETWTPDEPPAHPAAAGHPRLGDGDRRRARLRGRRAPARPRPTGRTAPAGRPPVDAAVRLAGQQPRHLPRRQPPARAPDHPVGPVPKRPSPEGGGWPS